MGYRSHVLLGVEEPLVSSLLTALSQSTEAFDMLFKHAEVTKGEDGSLLFNLEYVKWYTGYNCVIAIEDWMDECDTHDNETGYLFHRLGEEFGDHEERGCAERWSVYPNQYLEIS